MSRILIVEDEEAIAELEKDYLELNDFEVKIENSGDTGLATALAEEFDLIILDLMLPGIDGFEICKRIREDKNVPILMVSAKKDDIDKIRGLGLGADDYLTKPFHTDELLARIKVQLRAQEKRPEEALATVFTFQELELHTGTHTVLANGKETRLTRTEYAILKLLIQNPSQVIPKSLLLDRISDDTPDCTESSLKIHISNLRKKLRALTGKDYIEAVWGIGFKIRTE